jgi:hypothetical protein
VFAAFDPRFRVRGAVGFQPVIQPLPEGAMMLATGVVSADRRYARIEPFPTFSQIARVQTFNIATGQGNAQQGGAGGGAFGGGLGGGGLGGGFGGGGLGGGGGGFGGGGLGGGGGFF